MWVDKEQMESFINEYSRSSDQERFLSEKQAQKSTISTVRPSSFFRAFPDWLLTAYK